MRIVRLIAENIKCLSAIMIEPDPDESVVKVGGLNGAGKSSALDSIEYTLGGAASIPAVPIRTGQTKALTAIDLDAEGDFPAMHIERRFSAKGGSELIITADGKRLSSPQAILDALKGRVGFDPLAFTREKPAEQRRILQGLVGLDFTDLDKRRAAIFEERTGENRTVKELTAQAAGMEVFDDAPAEETSANALIEEIQAVIQQNATNEEQRRGLADLNHRICTKAADGRAIERQGIAECEVQDQTITDLTERLSAEKKKLADMQSHYSAALTDNVREHLELKGEYNGRCHVVESLTDQPTDALQQQLDQCEETNRQVRANVAAKELSMKLNTHMLAAATATGAIQDIDDEKQAAMESAEWPVEGLGFSDEGVTFNGLPFEQASQAQSIDVSVAMGFAANPTLRVMLIRDASLLDDNSLARIAKLAAEKDGQVWLERVGEGDCSVVIRDGAIAE